MKKNTSISFKQLFNAFAKALANLIAPPMCAYCKIFINDRTIFCRHCKDSISPVVSVSLPINSHYTLKVIAISDYKEPLKHLILAKGWSDMCASTMLGELIWDMTYIQHLPIDYLIPVPLHWTRRAKRGYNQTEEMAAVLSKKSSKPVAHIIKRIKRTQFQLQLSADDRGKNVAHAFALDVAHPQMYHGKHLVIVDDLMTTGSTLQAMAKELAKLKPASISAVVACRVV